MFTIVTRIFFLKRIFNRKMLTGKELKNSENISVMEMFFKLSTGTGEEKTLLIKKTGHVHFDSEPWSVTGEHAGAQINTV